MGYESSFLHDSLGTDSSGRYPCLHAGTAALFLWRKLVPGQEEPVDRMAIKRILIQLRKRVYSTLREISFIVNNIRTLEGDL